MFNDLLRMLANFRMGIIALLMIGGIFISMQMLRPKAELSVSKERTLAKKIVEQQTKKPASTSNKNQLRKKRELRELGLEKKSLQDADEIDQHMDLRAQKQMAEKLADQLVDRISEQKILADKLALKLQQRISAQERSQEMREITRKKLELERKRQAEIARLSELRRLEEERRLEEQRTRLAEERLAREKELAEKRRLAESEALALKKALEEQQRRVEMETLARKKALAEEQRREEDERLAKERQQKRERKEMEAKRLFVETQKYEQQVTERQRALANEELRVKELMAKLAEQERRDMEERLKAQPAIAKSTASVRSGAVNNEKPDQAVAPVSAAVQPKRLVATTQSSEASKKVPISAEYPPAWKRTKLVLIKTDKTLPVKAVKAEAAIGIDTIEMLNDKGKERVKFKMHNKSKEDLEGFIYAVATYQQANGKLVTLVSPGSVRLDGQGKAINPTDGVRFRMQHMVQKSLKLRPLEGAKLVDLKVVASHGDGRQVSKSAM